MIKEFPFRLTPQRRAIVEEVRGAEDHPRAAVIYERVRRQHPGLAYGTVYNTLRLLAEHGLIRSFDFGEGAARFDRRTERHDHVTCRRCGTLVDAQVALDEVGRRQVEATAGFVVDEYHVEMRGLCGACRNRRGPGE